LYHFCYKPCQTWGFVFFHLYQCCCNFINPDTICWSFFNCGLDSNKSNLQICRRWLDLKTDPAVTSGQHISTPVAGNILSNKPTIRTQSVTRSMCLHIVRSCRPLALLMQKWKLSIYRIRHMQPAL